MQIDRRITNGLAWAGLFLVVAVPVADAVSGQLMGDQHAEIAVASIDAPPALVAPIPAPLSQRPHAPVARPVVETAAVAPAKPVVPATAKPAAAANPVVDNFLSSGKALPSYIQDEPQQAAATPAAAPAAPKPVVAPVQTAAVPGQPVAPVSAPAAIDPIEVATLTPAKAAPMPMPLSMRPTPVTRSLASQAVNEDIVLPPEVVAGNTARPVVVDDLQDWESGPLSEFLAQRQRSSAVVNQNDPYADRPVYRPRRDVYLGPVEDEGFFPFLN